MSNIFKDSQHGFAISRLAPNQGMFIMGESYFPTGTATESRIVYTSEEEATTELMSSLGMVREFYAPTTLKRISAAAFMQQPLLEKVVLSDALTYIGDSAFVDCPNLAQINLNKVEFIGEEAFVVDVALREVHLDSAKTILGGAFAGCTNLVVYLNDNVEEVGESAFAEVAHLYYNGSLPGAPWGATAWN